MFSGIGSPLSCLASDEFTRAQHYILWMMDFFLFWGVSNHHLGISVMCLGPVLGGGGSSWQPVINDFGTGLGNKHQVLQYL